MSNRENDGPEQSLAEEKTGYRNPPMQRRFKQSGNPKGRPKGAINRKTIVKAVASERHSVTENGKRQQRSLLDIVLIRLRNMALEGQNVRAFEEFHRLVKTYQPQETDNKFGYLVVPAPRTMEEHIADGEKANAKAIARREAQLRNRT